MVVDLRGFTRLAHGLPPANVMALLAEYQKRVIPLVQQNNGSVDKFLGDGILVSFGAVYPSDTYAADALRAADSIVLELQAWRAARDHAGQIAPKAGVGVACGEVLFGAIGDESRLEYTIIGDAVNLAAKLEKQTKAEQVTALTDAASFDLALSQGYKSPMIQEHRPQRRIEGVDYSMNLVVLAA
jgi:adenylate cyclase